MGYKVTDREKEVVELELLQKLSDIGLEIQLPDDDDETEENEEDTNED